MMARVRRVEHTLRALHPALVPRAGDGLAGLADRCAWFCCPCLVRAHLRSPPLSSSPSFPPSPSQRLTPPTPLHPPLARPPPTRSPDRLARALVRRRRLRAFPHAALHGALGVQAYLQSRATGDDWVGLLAKLMVSSEEVAAALVRCAWGVGTCMRGWVGGWVGGWLWI